MARCFIPQTKVWMVVMMASVGSWHRQNVGTTRAVPWYGRMVWSNNPGRPGLTSEDYESAVVLYVVCTTPSPCDRNVFRGLRDEKTEGDFTSFEYGTLHLSLPTCLLESSHEQSNLVKSFLFRAPNL